MRDGLPTATAEKYLKEILMMLLTEELEVLHSLLRQQKLVKIT